MVFFRTRHLRIDFHPVANGTTPQQQTLHVGAQSNSGGRDW